MSKWHTILARLDMQAGWIAASRQYPYDPKETPSWRRGFLWYQASGGKPLVHQPTLSQQFAQIGRMDQSRTR